MWSGDDLIRQINISSHKCLKNSAGACPPRDFSLAHSFSRYQAIIMAPFVLWQFSLTLVHNEQQIFLYTDTKKFLEEEWVLNYIIRVPHSRYGSIQDVSGYFHMLVVTGKQFKCSTCFCRLWIWRTGSWYLTQLQTLNISHCIHSEVSFLLKLFVTMSQLQPYKITDKITIRNVFIAM